MGDVFKEQLVKKESSSKDLLIKIGIIAGVVLIIIVSAMFIPQFSIYIMFAVVFAAYFLTNMLKKEYEYIYTNGELDIDCITNRARRKRVFSSSVKKFDIMVHSSNKDKQSEFNGCQQTLDFSSGVVNDNTYYALLNYKGKITKLVFEPNDMLLQAMSSMLTPRKLIRR